MPQQDREFLREYARGSAEYVRAQPSRQDDETLTQYLRRVGVDDSAATGAPARGPNNTQPTANAPAQAREAQREQQNLDAQAKAAKLAAEQEARRKKAQGSLNLPELKAAGIYWNKAADTVENIQNWLATRPTPGGRGGMLLLLLIFGAFIIPVSQGGYTRAQLAWLTLLGKTELDDSGEPNGEEPRRKPPPIPPEPRPRPTGPVDTFNFNLPLPGDTGSMRLPS